jgi:alpha-tubulin suppressor-like RCC1 family protein
MRKLLALLAFAAVVSCSKDSVTDPDSVFGLDLSVTPPRDTLVATTQVQLVATATRSGVPLTSLPGHVWESSNQAVATVDQNGKVTAVAPGTADIAVRVNSVRAFTTVVVIAASSSGGGGGGGTTPGVFLGGTPGSIASGLDATCGIVTGGQTWCFGKAPLIGIAKDTSCFGRVGEWDAKQAPCSLVPLQIAGALSLTSLTVGDSVACGVAAGGAAYCWGDQTYGELGNGISADGKSSLPVRVTGPLTAAATFTQVSAGGSHVCALISGGSAYCWGRDDALQLGGGDVIKANASTPVPAAPGKVFKQIAAGRSFTCGLQADGVTFCWGDNTLGQLGRGTAGDTTENFVAVIAPAFTQISARGDNACGLTAAGTIYCWGDNRTAQTGRAAGGITSTPNQVGGTGYTYVAVGGRDSTIADGAVAHVCALAGSTVSCWGSNRYGQLGRNIAPGNLAMSSTPVAITGTYTALSSGTRTSCAVAADGAYCWGSSLWGATGNQVQAVAVTGPTKAQPPQ